MQQERATLDDLRGRLASLNADLYQGCASMSVAAFEGLCRRIHMIELKIHSFNVGRYGDKD